MAFGNPQTGASFNENVYWHKRVHMGSLYSKFNKFRGHGWEWVGLGLGNVAWI